MYEGDIINGLFDGKGKITLNTGQEYIGEFNMVLNPTMYKIYKRKYNK